MTTHIDDIEAGIEKWRAHSNDTEGVIIDWVTVYACARMGDEAPEYRIGYCRPETGVPWASTGMMQTALTKMEHDMFFGDEADA